MKIYQRKQQSVGKWILAGLAFLLVMTVTFADVYGVNVPGKPDGGNNDPGSVPTASQSNDQGTSDLGPTPSAVPEPSTMILMAMGLGAAAYYRSRKKA